MPRLSFFISYEVFKLSIWIYDLWRIESFNVFWFVVFLDFLDFCFLCSLNIFTKASFFMLFMYSWIPLLLRAFSLMYIFDYFKLFFYLCRDLEDIEPFLFLLLRDVFLMLLFFCLEFISLKLLITIKFSNTDSS